MSNLKRQFLPWPLCFAFFRHGGLDDHAYLVWLLRNLHHRKRLIAGGVWE
jgi:hypothetical protein